MQFIKKFKSALLYRTIRLETKKQNRSTKPKNVDDCASILILFDSDHNDQINQILKLSQLFREQGKRILLLATSSSDESEQKAYSVLTRKDINWYGKPNEKSQVSQIINKDWDCMLSLYVTPNSTLDYIGAKCRAFTKAGFYNGKNDYLDILVDLGKKDFRYSLKELLNILKTIKSRSYEPAV